MKTFRRAVDVQKNSIKKGALARPLLMIAAIVVLLLSGTPCGAVEPVSKAAVSKETQLKLLRLDEAKLSLQTEQDFYEDAQKNLKDLEELYNLDVVKGKEVSDADTEMKNSARKLEQAKIDLAKTALSFLQDATHITLVDAYQYIDEENNRHMALTLKNDSDLELAKIGLGEGLPEAGIKKEDVAGLLTIENLYVSIKVGSTVIGDPFEIKVKKLPLKKNVDLDFKLNSNADEVSVILKYHNQEDIRNIRLVKKSTVDIVRVSSLQFAQEGQLGTWVDFGIDLERLAENEKTFTLAVVNLPEKYQYKYQDKGNQLSRVKFSPGITKHSLTLKVNVPDTLPAKELKKAVPFYAVVGDEKAIKTVKEYEKDNPGAVQEEGLKALKIGFERLELTPRGTGKFEISLNTLYYEIKVGETINTKMTIKNSGTVKLSNIRFEKELPYEWKLNFDPEEVKSLQPRKEQEVLIAILPPDDVEVGEFELRIEGSTEYEGSTIKSDQKNLRVKIEAKTNLKGPIFMVLALLGFLIIIAIILVRVSRR